MGLIEEAGLDRQVGKAPGGIGQLGVGAFKSPPAQVSTNGLAVDTPKRARQVARVHARDVRQPVKRWSVRQVGFHQADHAGQPRRPADDPLFELKRSAHDAQGRSEDRQPGGIVGQVQCVAQSAQRDMRRRQLDQAIGGNQGLQRRIGNE